MQLIRFAILFALFVAPAFAWADDLDDAYAICMKHKLTGPMEPNADIWQGWPHCQSIARAKERRDETENANNSDLKKTRDMCKKLGAC